MHNAPDIGVLSIVYNRSEYGKLALIDVESKLLSLVFVTPIELVIVIVLILVSPSYCAKDFLDPIPLFLTRTLL